MYDVNNFDEYFMCERRFCLGIKLFVKFRSRMFAIR